jgi:hypothetical protein
MLQDNSSNGVSLRLVNQSVDEIRERNRTLERDLLNICKLFYLYQRHIEYKIEKARNANEMALEFFSVLGEQVDGVRRLVEESEFMSQSFMSSTKKEHTTDEKSLKDKRDRYGGSDQASWRRRFGKKNPEDATTTKIMSDLNGNKDQMIKEIQESQSSLNFILDYLRRLNFAKEGSPNLESSQHSDSNKSLQSNLNPENILGLADVDEFLLKTSHFFSGQKNQIDNDKGVKVYLVRIADLQKELKKKEEEKQELISRLDQVESCCRQHVGQFEGSL